MTRPVHPTQLPSPTAPVLMHYLDERGQAQLATPDEASAVAFERSTPVREFPRHRDQKHTSGLYWSATDRALLGFESYLECQWMTMFDFDAAVVAIRAQPLRIQCLDSKGSWVHTPDLFLRLSDGTGRIVDVKNPERLEDPDVQLQAARTREICERIPFDYELLGEPPTIPWLNVRWLAGYRRPFTLPDGLQDRVVAEAALPVRIGDLVDTFDVPELARTAVLRACWFGDLTFDLDAPLRDSTIVHATGEIR